MAETDELEELELTDEEKRRKAAAGTPPIVPSSVGTPISPKGAPEGTPSAAIGTHIGTTGVFPTPETENAPLGSELTPPAPTSIGAPIHAPAQPHARPNYDEYQRQLGNKAGVENVHGFGGALLKGLDIAGSIVAPGQMSLIPGTRLHHIAEVNRAGKAAGIENQEIASQGEEELRGAQTEEQRALAEKNARPVPPKEGLTPEETTLHDLMTGNGGNPRINPETQKPYTYLEAYQSVNQAKADTRNAPKPTFQEQSYDEWAKAQKAAGKPFDRMTYEKELKAAERNPDTGSYMPLYDDKGNVTGAWNPKTGHVQHAPGGVTGKTAPGQHIATEASNAVEKKAAPLRGIVEEADKAATLKDMADKGNAEADVDLALTFFKTMRSATSGSSGIRFTQQENNLIMGSRNFWGGLEVAGNKVLSNGQPLSKEQRQEILDVINVHKQAAQRQLQELQQGGGAPQSAEPSGGGVPSFKDWQAQQGKQP